MRVLGLKGFLSAGDFPVPPQFPRYPRAPLSAVPPMLLIRWEGWQEVFKMSRRFFRELRMGGSISSLPKGEKRGDGRQNQELLTE